MKPNYRQIRAKQRLLEKQKEQEALLPRAPDSAGGELTFPDKASEHAANHLFNSLPARTTTHRPLVPSLSQPHFKSSPTPLTQPSQNSKTNKNVQQISKFTIDKLIPASKPPGKSANKLDVNVPQTSSLSPFKHAVNANSNGNKPNKPKPPGTPVVAVASKPKQLSPRRSQALLHSHHPHSPRYSPVRAELSGEGGEYRMQSRLEAQDQARPSRSAHDRCRTPQPDFDFAGAIKNMQKLLTGPDPLNHLESDPTRKRGDEGKVIVPNGDYGLHMSAEDEADAIVELVHPSVYLSMSRDIYIL